MEKKELKVGETFQYGLVKLKCVKNENRKKPCLGCFFDTEDDSCYDAMNTTGYCCIQLREDHEDVIFVKVDD